MARSPSSRRVGSPGASAGYRADVAETLLRLLSDQPDVTAGKMFGYPAFYTRGRLFGCVYGDGVGLKLPVERVAALMSSPGFVPFRPFGKPMMREWVALYCERAEEYSDHLDLLLESMRFVREQAVRSSPSRRSGA